MEVDRIVLQNALTTLEFVQQVINDKQLVGPGKDAIAGFMHASIPQLTAVLSTDEELAARLAQLDQECPDLN